ncbi:hypothetical protein HanIR_Chr11g0542451 [Helianthus annuus]|nr:hypothetical protein HanIR_Chr11g0542451 [Helianthus annuus]
MSVLENAKVVSSNFILNFMVVAGKISMCVNERCLVGVIHNIMAIPQLRCH